MNWDDLRFVLALHRTGTLSAAGEALDVSHTTVARRLKSIEETLGARLFDATPEGYLATAAGLEAAEGAARIEAEALSIEAQLVGRDAHLRGTLHVSTMDLLARRYAGAIAAFVADHPSIDLSLTVADARASLPRREADVLIRLTNSPPESLVGRRIERLEFAAYGHVDLVCEAGETAGFEDLPWVSWTEGAESDWLDQWLRANAPEARVAMRIDASASTILDIVLSGVGVHFLPRFVAERHPELRRIGDVRPEFSTDVWLLTLPALRRNPRVRAFMDWISSAGLDRQIP